MDAATFSAKNQLLKQRFHQAMNEPDNDRYVIYDGPVNVERYLGSSIKIAWILKEPYEEEDGTGGDWSFTGAFDKEDLYNLTFRKPHRSTWHPIIYTTYGILNAFSRWDDMHYIRDRPNMCDIVRSLAIVNTQKLPALGRSRTVFSHIETSYNKHKELLHEQIEMLDADVHIFASTFWLYRRALGLADTEPLRTASADSYIKDGKLYIDAYHPAQTTVTRPAYIDDIVGAVEAWDLARII